MNQHSHENSFTKEELIAQELLDEKESDSNLRNYPNLLGNVITLLFLVWSVFQIYANTIGVIDAMTLERGTSFSYLFLPFTFPTLPRKKRRSLPPVWDIVLLV